MRQVEEPAAREVHVSILPAPRRPGGQAAYAPRSFHSTGGCWQGPWWQKAPHALE